MLLEIGASLMNSKQTRGAMENEKWRMEKWIGDGFSTEPALDSIGGPNEIEVTLSPRHTLYPNTLYPGPTGTLVLIATYVSVLRFCYVATS